jgi:hypothetical protein
MNEYKRGGAITLGVELDFSEAPANARVDFNELRGIRGGHHD